MSPIYVPGKVTLRQTWQPMDPDAAAYITAVEAADGQALEEKVKIAIDNFVLGCKADGIWTAIKASCILAGARTLAGALVPLKGTAPTNNYFDSGDYDRKTGLVGNGSTKYLDSNRNNNADPQDSNHNAVYVTDAASGQAAAFIAATGQPTNGTNTLGFGSGGYFVRNRSATGFLISSSLTTGFYGVSRSLSTEWSGRANKTATVQASTSQLPEDASITIFKRGGATPLYAIQRLAFYSIGESLDLARLDARVTDLINAIGVAIP